MKLVCAHLSNYYNWCLLEGLVTDINNKYEDSISKTIIDEIVPTELLIKSERATEFNSIKSNEDLINYLTDSYRRLSNKPGQPCNLYHYTKLSTVVNIINSGFWYLGNAKNMNDGLEYYHADEEKWKRIFFASFMTESNESLAMWSMYAQPWEDGVMITIPSNMFKRWVRSTHEIFKADPVNKKTDSNTYIKNDKSKVFISNIAYSNTDSKANGDIEITTCGNSQNSLLMNVTEDPELIGYIKNEAWAYEKEVRLRVDIESDVDFEGVSIEIPEYVVKSMIITKGPRFVGDLSERLENEVSKIINTKESLFFGKFRYIPCDRCNKR